jgi:hypothetical protein
MAIYTYILSNRLRKELLVRGCPIQVAIPLGIDLDVDPLAFAEAALPEESEWITQAEAGDVYVFHSPSTNLTKLLGQICEYDWAVQYGHLPISVNVVLATLTPPRPRNAMIGPVWPGKAFIDGKEIDPDAKEKS